MHCKNCKNILTKKSDFCNSCGAKVIRNRLTIKNLFGHFSEQFLNYDNKFIQTIIHLFKNPEDVIDGYINGIRKKYVNPVSFFAISLTVSGLYLFILQKFFPNTMDFSTLNSNENTLKITEDISQIAFDYNSLFYFILVPFLALISLILFYNKKYNYTEHIVIYLYTMSLGAVASSFLSLGVLLISPETVLIFNLATNGFLILYHCYLLKRVFKLSFLQLTLKSVLFIILFGISYVIFSFLLVIGIVYFTDATLQDLAPPS